MTCKWFSQRRKVQCQLAEHHDGMHRHEEYGRTTLWGQDASYIPKATTVNVIIPDSFRAVKRSRG